VTAGLAGLILAVTWQDSLQQLTPGSVVATGWFLSALLVIGIGFTVWARGIYVNGSTAGLALQRLPWWCRAPAAVGMLGFLLPGLGMLVMGRPRRAAWTLWSAGPVMMAILVLTHAGWLWRASRGVATTGNTGHALEVVFLVTVTVLVLGILNWLVQALDALRLVTHGVGARRSRRTYWLTALLVLVVILFGIWFDPAVLAEDLDRYALSLHAEGMRLIPLTLTLSAIRLDPAQPAYVIHAADLYSLLGRENRAAALRQELADRWRPFAQALRWDERWIATAGFLQQSSAVLTGGHSGTGIGGEPAGESDGGAAGHAFPGSRMSQAEASEDPRHGPYLNVVPALVDIPPE
jgi:hypothetical protein